MRRGGGDGGNNPRGDPGIQFNMKVPKFLMQMKQSVLSTEQSKVKEWEDRLNKEEDLDITGAQIVEQDKEEGKGEGQEKVDMETFKPKFISKKDRESNGMKDLKDEIENRKKLDLNKKQNQLLKMKDKESDKNKKYYDKNSDEEEDKEREKAKEERNKKKEQEQETILNQKRKTLQDAVKQLEKDTTKHKQVKKNLLSFNEDEE